MRPLKRFKVQVTVRDAEHNEIAVANLNGELEANDVPQVSFAVSEEIVHVPQDNLDAENGGGEGNEQQQNAEEQGDEGSDRTEMIVMGPLEGEVDEHIDANLTDLGSIMETVMGRQWFQLFVNREVDDAMVRKRWGATALEVFQINRDMMELQQGDKDIREDKPTSEGLHVRPMSEDEESLASSGPKVFPRRVVVAGRRGEDSLEGEEATTERDVEAVEGNNDVEQSGLRGTAAVAEMEREGMTAGSARPVDVEGEHGGTGAGGGGAGGGEAEVSQQVLENTQIDVAEMMDVAEEEGGGSSAAGTAGTTEGLHNGSFGDGKVQTDLQSWLK